MVLSGTNLLTDLILMHGFDGAFKKEPGMMWDSLNSHFSSWAVITMLSLLWQTHTELLRRSKPAPTGTKKRKVVGGRGAAKP
jgi:hypothetical protein